MSVDCVVVYFSDLFYKNADLFWVASALNA